MAVVNPIPPPPVFAQRLSDLSGGTMTYPGSEVLIPTTDPTPVQYFDTLVQSPPELGGGGGGRQQTL